MRIVQVLLGVVLAGGGGYLAWLNRALAPQLFPPDPHHAPWMLVAGLAGAITGLVLLVEGLLPHPTRKAQAAAEAERRRAGIAAADVYYAERARAADRDWRSGDLPPGPSPIAPAASPFDTPPFAPSASAPVAIPAAGPSIRPAAASFAGSAFPSAASLAPIPQSVDGPLPLPTPPPVATPVARPTPATPPMPVTSPGPALVFDATGAEPAATPASDASAGGLFDAIRAALAAGRLDDADRLLADERARLTAGGADAETDLAELTGLAGDHAAASGRIGGAKWLWRLSLQRFGAANAMASPAARAVSERLRLADQ
jgi:hypothetical protein